MKLEELKEQVDKGLSIGQLSKHFKKGKSTIRHWLRKFNLKTQFKNNTSEERNCVVCNELLKGNQRKFCSNKCKSKGHYNSANTYQRQSEKSRQRRLFIIEKKGGCCERCGYKKNLSALDFHHKNRNEKKFNLCARTLANRSLDEILLELEKCILLCANCHREEHYPEMDLGLIKQEQFQNDRPLVSPEEYSNRFKNYCDCGKEIYPKATKCVECYQKTIPRKAIRPPLEQLLQEVKSTNYSAVGNKYGVSDNAIRKWIKAYGAIPPKFFTQKI